MAEEINIGNVGANGVASEVTLVRLVAAMENMNRKSGGGPASAAKQKKILEEQYALIQKQNAENKKSIPEVKKTNKALGFLGKAAKESTKAIASMGGAIAGNLVGSITGLGGAFIQGQTDLSSFAKQIPIVGGVVSMLTGIIDTNIAAFTSMSAVGANFGDGILGVTRAAAAAGMPLDMFVGLLQQNSTRMEMFGSTTTAAARNFGAMSKEFRNGPGKALINVGYTVGDLNELLLDYAEYQDMQMGKDRLNSRINLKDAKEYGLQMREMAIITGKNRKQLADEMRERMSDSRQQVALDSLIGDQKKQFEMAQAIASKLGPRMSEAVLDMVDGVPKKGSIAEGFMNFSETFRNGAADLKNMTRAQQEKFFVDVNKDTEDFKKRNNKTYQMIIGSGSAMAQALEAGTELTKAKISTQADLDKEAAAYVLEQQKDTAIKNFQNTIMALKARFDEVFFAKDGPLELFTTQLGKLLTWAGKEENLLAFENRIIAIAEGLTLMLKSIQKFVTDIGDYGLKTAIFGRKAIPGKGPNGEGGQEAVAGIFGGAGEDMGIAKMIGGFLVDIISEVFSGLGDAIDIDWSTIAIGTGIGVAAIAALFLLPLTGTAGLIAGVVGGLAVAGTAAYWSGAFDPAIASIKGWGDSISTSWDNAKAAMVAKYTSARTAITGVGNTIGTAWDDSKSAISGGWTTAKNSIVGAGNTIGTAWDDSKSAISGGWTTAKNKIVGAGNTIATAWDDSKSAISAGWTTAKNRIISAGNTIATAWDDSKSAISAGWTNAKNKIVGAGNTVGTAWDDSKSAISAGWATAKNNVVAAGTGIKDAMTWANLKQGFTDATTGITNVADGIASVFGWTDEEGGAKALFKSAWTNVTGVGAGIMSKFGGWETVKGINWTEEFGKIWSKVREFFTFDFEMPNFKSFLPTWLGGQGKDIPTSDNGTSGKNPPAMPDTSGSLTKTGLLNDAKQAINTIIDVPNLKTALAAIKSGMDSVQVESFATALSKVAEQLEAINKAGSDVGKVTPGFLGGSIGSTKKYETSPANKALNSMGNQNGSATELNALNTTMALVLAELRLQTPPIKKAALSNSTDVARNVSVTR